MLDAYQYPGDDTPFIRCSALKALNNESGEYGVDRVLDLMKAVDEFVPTPERPVPRRAAANTSARGWDIFFR